MVHNGVGMVWASIRRENERITRRQRMLGEYIGPGNSNYTDYDEAVVKKTIDWFKKFDALKDAMADLDRRTNDSTIDTIADRMKGLFNQYRTYIRKNYPEEYSKFQTAENIDPKSQAKHKGKSAPFGSGYKKTKKKTKKK